MQLDSLTRTTKNKGKKTVGRGGKRGTFSGRGIKGQRARAGHKIRPEIRDIIKKIPKRRGRGSNALISVHTKPVVVNVSTLDAVFSAKDEVTPKILIEKDLIQKKGGKTPNVKILGNGNLTKALTISLCGISKQAREKIEKAGGTVSTKKV